VTVEVADLRAQLETDLVDETLTGMLAAAYEAIEERYGPIGPVTETRRPAGALLMLSRRAIEILSVVENDVPREAVDWFLRPSGRILERATGTWYGQVVVEYQPASDALARDRVAIALVKLEADHKPLVTSVRFGSWAEAYDQGSAKYEEEREGILASLRPSRGLIR
jgi:hypothetical protein